MPDTTCLHIRVGESDPIRVFEIAGMSVRIGRASFCEVRIPEPELAEEECRLRKRGGAWQLVPARPANAVTIEGRPVDATCPLPFDVPFRVGGHWLTLRATNSAQPDWTEYAASRPAEAAPSSAVAREGFRAAPLADIAPPVVETKAHTPAQAPANVEHLADWRSRQEQRLNRTRTGNSQRSWEERWKAAGDRLKTRNEEATPPAAPPRSTPPPAQTRYAQPQPLDAKIHAPRATPPVAPSVSAADVLRTPVDRLEIKTKSYKARESKAAATPTPSVSMPNRTNWEPPQAPVPTEPSLGKYVAPSSTFAVEREPRVNDFATQPEMTTWERASSSMTAVAIEQEIEVEPSYEDSTVLHNEEEATAWDEVPASMTGVAAEQEIEVEPSYQETTVLQEEARTAAWDEAPTLMSQAVTEEEAAAEEEIEVESSCQEESAVLRNEGEVTAWSEAPSSATAVDVNQDVEIEPRYEEITVSAPAWEPTAEPAPVHETVSSDTPAPSRILRLLSPLVSLKSARAVSAPAKEPSKPEAPATEVTVEAAIPVSPPPQPEASFSGPASATRAETWIKKETVATEPRTAEPSDRTETRRKKTRSAPPTNPAANRPRPQAEAHTRQPGRENTRPQNGQARPSQRPGHAIPRETPPGPKAPAPLPGMPPLSDARTSRETAREWPRASDIFAAHEAPAPRPAQQNPARRLTANLPQPTEWQEPSHWKLPLWAGAPALILMVLPLGVLTLALSWIWTGHEQSAGIVSDVLLHGDVSKPLPDQVIPRDMTWWKTSAGNLTLWASYFERRSQISPNEVDDARDYLEGAAKTSPIHAQTRLARARFTNASEPDAQLAIRFGLSRDIVALAFSGQRCLKAGRKEAALKLYRQALEMTSSIQISNSTVPKFDDESQVRRYRIPNEGMIERIIRDIASDESWTFAEWSQAIPSTELIRFVTAKVLTERGDPEASKVIDQMLEQAKSPTASKPASALDAAAQAEVFALRRSWEEAQEHYRTAISMMPNDLIRRSWWLNLADLALRLNDESGRQKALEQAKGIQNLDEVAKRATELLKFSSVRAEKAQPGR